tara:strand:- start:392 stop:811 length:420 start_codon:yes stop_codon:yes gene_type:complete
MSIHLNERHLARNAALVDVITDTAQGASLGYEICGAFAGPTLLVAGHTAIADLVYDRLMKLPTLAWMHGTLVLLFLDRMEKHGLDFHVTQMTNPEPDELVFLPFDLDPAHHAAAAQDGFNDALNVSVRLGMIAAIVLPA